MAVDDVAHAEKVRGTFDEMDMKRTRGFGLDEFVTVLQRLHIDFSLSTIRDVFDRADANKDGVVSFTEYQRFAELYPTLLDSLYYRSKDYWTDVHQLENLEAARRDELLLKDKEEQARIHYIESQQATDQQQRRVQIQWQYLKEAQDKEAEAKDVVARAHERTEAARNEVRERAAVHAEARDNERVVQNGLNEARHAVEMTAQTARDAELAVSKAEAHLRELEKQAQEQRALIDRLRLSADHARADVGHAQETEQAAVNALMEAQRAVQLSGERLSTAEADLDSMVVLEREANEGSALASNEVARLHSQHDAEERELHMMKQKEDALKAAEDAAAAAVEEQQRVIAALDAQNKDFNGQRLEVEQEEAPLLEQEVLLRQQRESLEDREAELRNSSNAFLHSRRSLSPGQSRAYKINQQTQGYSRSHAIRPQQQQQQQQPQPQKQQAMNVQRHISPHEVRDTPLSLDALSKLGTSLYQPRDSTINLPPRDQGRSYGNDQGRSFGNDQGRSFGNVAPLSMGLTTHGSSPMQPSMSRADEQNYTLLARRDSGSNYRDTVNLGNLRALSPSRMRAAYNRHL
ncbi:calmodulin-like protein containing EF hand domain [Diplonema papillatum]|nr:calmodulin-like protein containing EF hand domain [Diplonema papillatum]|eukprot:gene20727-31938_t